MNFSPKRAIILASHFASLKEFLTVEAENFRQLQSVSGKRILFLSEAQIKAIKLFQSTGVLSAKRDTSENFLIVIARDFVRKQTKMLDELTLDRMSPNPFLIKCLNLKTPREVVELNVYMFATRSIVTSMGFFVEKLLSASSDSAEKFKTAWDSLKIDSTGKLWDFINDDPNHYEKLLSLLSEAASQILGAQSIEQRIQASVEEIAKEFTKTYGSSGRGVKKYLAESSSELK